MRTITSILALCFSMIVLTACSNSNTEITEDSFEPNDDIANATPTLASTQYQGRQWDDDWFRIDVITGFERVDAVLTFAHVNGDINLELYDASDNLLAASTSTSDNEQINFTVSTGGDYYLRVYGSNSGNTYELSWETFAPPPADDLNEPNNDFASATALAENTPINAVQLDDDWYRITVAPGFERVAANLTFSNTNGDIDLQLYDSSGASILATSNSNSNDFEKIVYDVSASGNYYLRVYDHQGVGTANTYSLSWEGRPAVDDLFEENDDAASATALAENTSISGIQLDEDWYQIVVTPGSQHLIINLTFTTASGDLDIELRDSSNALVTFSDTGTDNEVIDTIVGSSGTYYIRVYLFGGPIGNTYNLSWVSSP